MRSRRQRMGGGIEDAAKGGMSTQHPGCCLGAAVVVKLVATMLSSFQGKDGSDRGSARLAMPGSICGLMVMPGSIWWWWSDSMPGGMRRSEVILGRSAPVS